MEYHYKPHIMSQSAWTAHYRAMSEGSMGARKVYRLKEKYTKPKSEEKEKVEIVAPTQQIVSQAESEVHDEEMPDRMQASYRPEMAQVQKVRRRGGKGSGYVLKRKYRDDIFN